MSRARNFMWTAGIWRCEPAIDYRGGLRHTFAGLGCDNDMRGRMESRRALCDDTTLVPGVR